MHMNKRVKLALAALLGFSAACSTVKNAPARNDGAREGVQADTTAVDEAPRIMLMYGVRPPVAVHIPDAELDPVTEVPGPDTLQTVTPEPATTSGLDPIVESPEE